MGKFDDLIETTAAFALKNKNAFDGANMLELYAELQKKGFEVTEDLKAYVGTVFDAMRDFYKILLDTKNIETTTLSITDFMLDFMKRNKGRWGYGEWETFTRELVGRGVNLNQELIVYMKGIFDAVRKIYSFQLW
ncbi:MAG: hypothetical protein HQK89_07400 [Nitrospirae bacterium]|nr:hypothetical protein [Nitrospirota bacterium]